LISNIYVINAFLDLIRKGSEKKIAFVSSQSANVEFTRITGMATLVGYSIAKAGMNMVMTKFNVELAQEGIKFLSISPGWVATDAGEFIHTIRIQRSWIDRLTDLFTAEAVTGDPEVRKWILGAFHKLDPDVEGPAPVEEAVANQLRVIKGLTEADGGKFLTHHGDETTWF
jgi:NAD(P)-dependent dehydrogenase (short-subunit alcohol dehydrogenase family)